MADATIALKIKKLLETAGRDEAEAASYIAKAMELAAKHNLALADLRDVTDPKLNVEREQAKRSEEKLKRGAMYEYQQRLWQTICDVNFCMHWLVNDYKTVNGVHRRVNRHHVILGREDNVVIAKMMGEYLEQTINRLCPWQGKECLSRSAISWKEGCANRLQQRLMARKVELKKESQAAADAAGAAGAIVLASVYDNEYDANYAARWGEDALRRRKTAIAAANEAAKNPQPVILVEQKPETEAQRKKREAREARDQAKWQRQQDKYWERRDVDAWMMGHRKANDINLDSQVDSGKDKPSLE